MGTDKYIEHLYKDLTYKIIGAIYEVHKELGNVHKYKLILLANFGTNKVGIKRLIFTGSTDER